jgi:hypothetical protein
MPGVQETPLIHADLNVTRGEPSGLDRCSACNRPARDLEVVYVRNHVGDAPSVICEPCFLEMTDTCECCNVRVRRSETRQLSSESDGSVCMTCYHAHYTQCGNCRNVVHRDRMDDRYDGRYCTECAETMIACTGCGAVMNRRDSERSICAQCRRNGGRFVKDYNWKPPQVFFESESDIEPFIHFGYENELELASYGDQDTVAKWVSDIVNGVDEEHPEGFNTKFCYLKHDGSLSSGFEIVSRPMTLAYHLAFEGWDRLYRGIASHMIVRDTCGLHIHVERKDIGEIDELKLVRFFEFNQAPLKRLSRRRGGWNYCCNYGSPFQDIPTLQSQKNIRAKFRAVNFNPTETIEIRIFAGTAKRERLFASIEFCDALLKFNKEYEVDETKKPLWYEFAQRIEEKKEDYPHLFDEMQRLAVSYNHPHGCFIQNYIRGKSYTGRFVANDGAVAIEWDGDDQAVALNQPEPSTEENWDSPCNDCHGETCSECTCNECEEDCHDCSEHRNYDRNHAIRDERTF